MANFIFDAEARHQHYLERFKTGEVNTLNKFIISLEEKIVMRLSKSENLISRKRMRAVLKQINDDTISLLTEYSKQLNTDLAEFSLVEAEFVAQTLAKATDDENFTVPTIGQLKIAANARPFTTKLLREELNDFPRQQARAIRNVVAMGFAEGKSNPEIITDVIGTSELKFKDGATQVTRNQAGRMVRTSVQHVAAVARQSTYEKNNIEKYAWTSTLDSRTSPTCKARDGRVYTVGRGPIPPAHPNCRSTTVVVFEGESEVIDDHERLNLSSGLRPDVGDDGRGKTNVKNNYNNWLKRQSKSFQVDALGASRAELFRKGGLTMDKFVDRLDKPLTLAELQQTFPTAWEKAKLA